MRYLVVLICVAMMIIGLACVVYASFNRDSKRESIFLGGLVSFCSGFIILLFL